MTTGELVALEQKQKEERSTEVIEEEVELEEVLTTAQMREMLRMWENVRRVVEAHHPNKMNTGCSVNLFEENSIRNFRDVC